MIIFSTFAIAMEIKVGTTNKDGKILAYDGDELVGQLEFSFDDNIMRIEHTYAFKEGIGVGGLLVFYNRTSPDRLLVSVDKRFSLTYANYYYKENADLLLDGFLQGDNDSSLYKEQSSK